MAPEEGVAPKRRKRLGHHTEAPSKSDQPTLSTAAEFRGPRPLPQFTFSPRWQRQVEFICEHPRMVSDLLVNIGITLDALELIEDRVAEYSAWPHATLRALGADQFPVRQLHLVPR